MSGDRTHRHPSERRERPIRQLRITVVGGKNRGEAFEVVAGQVAAVGSATDNDLVLDDPAVSRYHLDVRPGGRGIELTDLGSLNGSHVGGMRLMHAVVPPGTRVELGDTVIEVAEGAPLEGETPQPRPSAIPGLIGESEAMAEVVRQIRAVAGNNVSVLIQGETGTGKEVVARALHELSARASKPFFVVDCASLPATLIASELFGHERGAFTGADQRKIGGLEAADGGTVFLDEIGELPLSVQPALLGVLERRAFRRLGGTKVIKVDVRLLSATHRDLRAEVNAGSYRADLYYRIAVARIALPPLRERVEDIEPLVEHFVREQMGTSTASPFGPSTMEALRRHPWSGNARELRNVVEAALAMGRVQLDATRDRRVAEQLTGESSSDGQAEVVPYRDARAEAIATFERGYLQNLITACEGNASEAARQAKMDRPYLLSLLKRHGLR